MYYYGFGYNKSFFKNLLNFNASVLNPFREYALRRSTFTDGNFSRTQERQVGISEGLCHRFGSNRATFEIVQLYEKVILYPSYFSFT